MSRWPADKNLSGYRSRHGRCAICGIHVEDTWEYRDIPRLQIAHIIGGPSRRNIGWNVLMLCGACHGSQHNSNHYNNGVRWPNITHGMLFAAKKRLNELEADELSKLWGKTEGYVAELSDTEFTDDMIEERKKWI